MSRKVVETLERVTLAEYIGRTTSIEMARNFLRAIETTYERLADMPGIGVSRGYLNPELSGLRMVSVPRFPNHLIFYVATETTVEIIRVLHGARNLETIFDPEEGESIG